MSQKDLIPLNQRTKAEALVLQKRGGATKTPQKKYAAKVREIKKRIKNGQIADTDAEWLIERVEDNKSMALDMLSWIEEIKSETDLNKRAGLLAIYNQIYKSIHGEKIKIDMQVHHVTEDIDRFFKRKGKVIDAEIVQEVKKDEQV